MRYYTHVTTSVAATAVTFNLLNQPIEYGILAGVIVGAILPDIDEPESKVGKKLPGISHLIKFFYGHRGVFHSGFAILAMLIVTGVFSLKYQSTIFLGVGIGYMLHILGDVFFESGVPLMKPFNDKRYGILGFKVGGIMEHIIFLASIYIIVDAVFLRNMF